MLSEFKPHNHAPLRLRDNHDSHAATDHLKLTLQEQRQMYHAAQLILTTATVISLVFAMPLRAEEIKGGVFISQASQAASREYASCVRATARANYARLRETMFAGAWTAGQAAMIGSGLCKARWEVYEAATAADFRAAGVPVREMTPRLRDGIDANIADQLLESESEEVPLCKVQQSKRVPTASCAPASAPVSKRP